MPRKTISSDFFCRPICIFIVISSLMLCGSCILTSLWIKEVQEINEEAKVISHKIFKGILSEIHNIDVYASTTHLVRFLVASIGDTNTSLQAIQQKVAPTLSQALLMIPHLSQITYIGFDGLFFSYYTKENRHFVYYSNDSFSSPSNSTWYTQSINEELGTPYGEPIATSPSNLVNTSWFKESFISMNKSTSIGYGWSNNEDILFSNTLCLNGKGVISLGIPLHFLANYFSLVTLHNGSLYLDIENGIPLTPKIPNTHVIFSNDSSSIKLVNGKGDEIARNGDITCRPNGDKLNLWGRKYVVSCSQLQIFGIELEYVLVVPNEQLESFIKHEDRFAYLLLLLIIITIIIFILFFVLLIVSAAKREICLSASLIKQMEATQQAERKCMNKSLAFARASHDVRTSLAGINGLIEISRESFQQKTELEINLMQMQGCTKDLLGILNSILDTSKIEAGKLQLKEEDFDLQKLVEDVVDFQYNIGIKKGVDVILDISDESLLNYSCVRGDRGKLKQILDNLLNNAIKFTQEGHVIVRVWAKKPSFEKEILVSNWSTMISKCMPCSSIEDVRDSEIMKVAQCNPKYVEFVFEVSDTGIGIPKEKQKFVFENYVQVNDEARSGQEGTGLGLCIVQSLVRLLGGEIGIIDKIRSERGTCFRFNVYFSSEPKEYGANEIGSFKGEGSSQVILFIQNEERGRIIKKFMEIRGIKVFVVKDHHEFCSRLQRIRKGKSPSLCHSSSENSCPKSKDIPLSTMDGGTNGVKSSSSFNLILVDKSSSALHETQEVLKEFRREIGVENCRVVWMQNIGTQSIEVKDLDESADVIVSKSLHGSRLNHILNLLPEYGGSMPSIMQDLMTSKVNVSRDVNLRGCDKLDTDRAMMGKRVLVAEDNVVQQMVAKQILSKLGAEVDLCGSGAKAVELVSNGFRNTSKQPYDYIFMDCKMENMDGFEASRHIREEEENYDVHIPIIALTAHVVEDVIELIKNARMDHYLCKPLKAEQLLEAIEFLNS